jgi:hypothetical protein
MLLRIDIHRWFAMVAIFNPKWPPKYKNPPISTKFGYQLDYDVSNHHNLLGNQISSQSEDFCILAAILDYSKWPS